MQIGVKQISVIVSGGGGGDDDSDSDDKVLVLMRKKIMAAAQQHSLVPTYRKDLGLSCAYAHTCTHACRHRS